MLTARLAPLHPPLHLRPAQRHHWQYHRRSPTSALFHATLEQVPSPIRTCLKTLPHFQPGAPRYHSKWYQSMVRIATSLMTLNSWTSSCRFFKSAALQDQWSLTKNRSPLTLFLDGRSHFGSPSSFLRSLTFSEGKAIPGTLRSGRMTALLTRCSKLLMVFTLKLAIWYRGTANSFE